MIAQLPPYPVGIVGASGYTGAELITILLRHSRVQIAGLFGSEKAAGEPGLSQIHPRLRGRLNAKIRPASAENILQSGAKLVFLATPHELSHELAPVLLEKGLRVIDLSGAFRSPQADFYSAHYGFTHRHPEWTREAVYGLSELFDEKISRAKLIANPGCYPTSILLPLKPLLDAKLLDLSEALIADSISGVSGAGRQAKPELHFCEVSVKAYGIFHHRHQPEIEQGLGTAITFVPHLAPFSRGMLSTMHTKVNAGVSEEDLRFALQQRYEGKKFIRLLPTGIWPSVQDVVGSNFCDIALALDAKSRRLVLISAIDNLLKGAAGQAVQNMNLMLGYEETEGLL